MAVIVVAFDGTRWADAESASPTSPSGGDWLDAGAAVLGGDETNFVYQGTFSVSEQVKKNNEGMVAWVPDTPVDMSSSVILMKTIVTTPGIMGTSTTDGINIEIGSGGHRGDYFIYYFAINTSYPPTTSWNIIPIDVNISGYADVIPGTAPTTNSIDYVSWRAYATALAKAENIAQDALDYIPIGKGLTMTDGIGSTAGVFSDFSAFDGDDISTRYGICTTVSGIFYILGVLTLGDGDPGVNFDDSNQTIVFPDGRFGSGFAGIDFDLNDVDTTIVLTSCTFVGKGFSGGYLGIANGTDSRPDVGVIGTSGTATINSCSFQNFNDLVFTSGVTATDTVFLNPNTMTQGDAAFDGCTFDSPTNANGVAFMQCNNPTDLTNNTFVSNGVGYAIELTSACAGNSYNLVGNVWTGYAGTDGSTGDEVIYNNINGADVTLNVSNGATPTVHDANTSTTIIVASVSTTVTIKDTAQNLIGNCAVGVYLVSDGSELANELTPTSGGSEGQVTFSSDPSVDVTIRARKNSPGDTRYFPSSQTANTGGSGTTVTITLTEDVIASA